MEEKIFNPNNELSVDEIISQFRQNRQVLKSESFQEFQQLALDDVKDLNIMFLFSIFDGVSGLFGNVFMNTSKEVVIRDLKNILKDDSHTYNQTPEKFHLVCLGNFDVTTGILNPSKIYVCSIADIKNSCENTL